MTKVISFIIELIYWLQFFITPVILGGLIGLYIYNKNENLLWLSILIETICVILGIWYAERTRKQHGNSRYAARINATPDIWPDEYPEEIEERENKRSKKI
ncbi:MAG: hypothetical protein ABI653_00800 [Bacteroidota bacterium]